MARFRLKNIRISSVHFIPISFLIFILLGTGLLMLPISSASGQYTDFVTALFTSTTSVCVTGLVVVDTFAHWSLFQHFVDPGKAFTQDTLLIAVMEKKDLNRWK